MNRQLQCCRSTRSSSSSLVLSWPQQQQRLLFFVLAGSILLVAASSMTTTSTTTSPSRRIVATTSPPPPSSSSSSPPLVKNFRPAACLPNIYRCAKTDNLSSSALLVPNNEGGGGGAQQQQQQQPPESSSRATTISLAEQILLYEAGLVIDLRSDSERDEEKSLAWMSKAPGGAFRVVTPGDNNDINQQLLEPLNDDDPSSSSSSSNLARTVLRLDPLHPAQFMAYLDEHWLTAAQKAQVAWGKLFDSQGLHCLRMRVLNQQGLYGLNQAILETGQADLCTALQAMTVQMERTASNNSKIVVHCVQGKDRTGLLIMLCQSMVGASDEEIVNCYHLTEQFMLPRQQNGGGSSTTSTNNGEEAASAAAAAAAVETTNPTLPSQEKGRLDRRMFAGAPVHVMEQTLAYLRDEYSSVCPGYLNAIGFDADWQHRFRKACQAASSAVSSSSSSSSSAAAPAFMHSKL